MKVKIKESGWTVVPADVYNVRVKKVEELDLEYGHCAKLVFEIVGGDYNAEEVDGIASYPEDGISPKSKLYTWLLAILGSLDDLEEFDLLDLVGKPCRINVEEKKKDDGSEFNKITAVLPPPKKKAVKPVAAAEDF